MNTKKHVRFSGRVQGVYFRATTKRKADELGVFGWVRNMEDGSVEAVFEAGSESVVNQLIDWCANSVPMARVTDVDAKDYTSEEKFAEFEIKG